jgi:hypothetical protein
MFAVWCTVTLRVHYVTFQADFRKNKENLSKLNEAIDLMERHLEEQKKNLERLMAAEITLRFLFFIAWFLKNHEFVFVFWQISGCKFLLLWFHHDLFKVKFTPWIIRNLCSVFKFKWDAPGEACSSSTVILWFRAGLSSVYSNSSQIGLFAICDSK